LLIAFSFDWLSVHVRQATRKGINATLARCSVMKPQLSDFEALSITAAGHTIDHAIFFGDPSGPPATKVSTQRFWFTNALERQTLTLLDKFIHTIFDLWVSLNPMLIVFPSFSGKH
jgi:hypothetical protein